MSDIPGADDLGMELIPADDAEVTADEELAVAVESALAPEFEPIPTAQPTPLGSTWLFDFEAGRFVMRGADAARVTGAEALAVWCQTAIHTARYAHGIFSDQFGMERAGDPIGEAHVAPLIRDYEDRLRRALTVHERIADVTDFEADYDPATGILTIHQFDVVLDDETVYTIEGEHVVAPSEEA